MLQLWGVDIEGLGGVTQCTLLSHQPHPQDAHCNESLVWLKGADNPSSLTLGETPLRYPAVGPSHGDLVAVVHQDQSPHTLRQVIDGVDVRVGTPKAPDESGW